MLLLVVREGIWGIAAELFTPSGHHHGHPLRNRIKLTHPLARALMKVDFNDVDAVVISHGHGDHTAATVEVVQATGGRAQAKKAILRAQKDKTLC